MAIGDDAAAAGMPVMTGNEQANTLDTEMNLTRDLIAQRTSTVTPIAKGGTGATTAAAARASLGITAGNIPTAPPGAGASDVQSDLNYLGASVANLAATKADATALASKANKTDLDYVQDGNMTSNVYNRIIGGSYRVLYVAASGVLGWVSSSRRYKKNIKRAVLDLDAVLAMELVTFQYKVAIDPDGAVEHGLIAEQLHELGLTWLVDYGDGDQPEGVRYERLALALLPLVQNLAKRLAAIETHLDALGGDLDAPTS